MFFLYGAYSENPEYSAGGILVFPSMSDNADKRVIIDGAGLGLTILRSLAGMCTHF